MKGISIHQWIKETINEPHIRPRVILGSGVSLSIQGSQYHYCSPCETGLGSYKSLEIGYPSEVIEELKEYCSEFRHEDDNGEPDYLNTVYAHVPVDLINNIINHHGGIVGAQDNITGSFILFEN